MPRSAEDNGTLELPDRVDASMPRHLGSATMSRRFEIKWDTSDSHKIAAVGRVVRVRVDSAGRKI